MQNEWEKKMGLLDGKVAIVTGAGGGLGEAYAKLFAHEGAAVLVNDLGLSLDGTGADQSAAERVAHEIRSAGGRAEANLDDVSTKAGGERILADTIKHFGQVDILVNNAGILRDKSFGKTSESDWDAVIKVHLKGAYCVTLPVWQSMKEAGRGGVIVLTASTSGMFGNFGQANYAAAKAGTYGLMRVLAIEGVRYGIRLWGLAPSAYTRLTADLVQEPDPATLPDNIAPALLYMVSDLSLPHTGKMLGVSGRSVREIRVVQAEGFQPTQGWSAEDLADNLEKVFLPGEPDTAISASQPK
jgi:NAD(P)-dependent dehydrogenase (short-subunit alcohol dehydrogenase family)